MTKMIDKTIESICSAVQGTMGNSTSVGDISEYAGVISALAELIKANAEYKIADFQGKSTMECYLSSKSSKESWKKFTSIEEGGGVRSVGDIHSCRHCDCTGGNSCNCIGCIDCS